MGFDSIDKIRPSAGSFVLAPSILSADFAHLGEEIAAVQSAGAGVLHVDVMDGRFVPNITIGLPVVKSIRHATEMVIDAHLMIVEPGRYAAEFVKAGANLVSVHVEADRHLHRTLASIRDAGGKAGIAINPATPLSLLDEALQYADFVLLMSVNPGFGGQKFIGPSLEKLRRLRRMIDDRQLNVRIEIDGGIDASNIAEVVAAGAQIVVAGSAIFGSGDSTGSVRMLLEKGTVWV
ncbi:MAG: ribulose-phosphate 3-epimerase [Blastocatellia bacterium]